jgi:hypothetical protein
VSINSSTPGILGGGGGGGDVPSTRAITAGTGLTGGGDLSADRTLTVDFGTTSGKAAQGDDSRIVGAVQTSRIFGGLDLSADRSVDAVNASLNARSEFTLDSGWTDVISSGSISRASGVTSLGVTPGGLVRQHRATICTPESPNIEIIGRFVVTSTIPPPTVWHTALMLADANINYGFMVLVFDNAGVGLYKGDGAGLTLQAATGANAVVFTGSSWVRLVVTPSYASASYGTSATSTPPTSWTVAASAATTASTLAGGFLNRVQVRMGRTAAGSGTYTCEWRNVQARILGSAP